MELKGSRTEANLMAAFAGSLRQEISTPICLKSKKEGYHQIAAIF